jgi:hypothetical protein
MFKVSRIQYAIFVAALGFAASPACAHPALTGGVTERTPAEVADELLAADRAFAAKAAQTDLVSGISAMFTPDVTMPIPGGKFATTVAEAVEAMKSNPANTGAKVTWTPVRAGVSADGLHGFTYGYATVTKADNSQVLGKYLSYWVKGADGWRVAVYKRALRAAGDISTAMVPPALPPKMIAPVTDATAIDPHRQSLDAAERAFSSDAQKIGLGPAFAQYGSADAVNMGGPDKAEFVRGAGEIAKAVTGGSMDATSPVSWGPDRVIVASSGDLGVTIGMIRRNGETPPGQASAFPFFTIWRRDSVSQPWKYVAE